MTEHGEPITLWQGPTWSLQANKHVTLDGDQEISAYIDHPGSVVLVPLIKPGPTPEVLFLRQYRESLSQIILEVPAGTRGWEEPWLSCAQRELREETGYRADDFTSLGNCWPAPGLSNELMSFFLAIGLSADPLPQDEDEDIEVVQLQLLDLVAMALDGRLMDAKSVVAVLRTAAHLQLLR